MNYYSIRFSLSVNRINVRKISIKLYPYTIHYIGNIRLVTVKSAIARLIILDDV